MELAIAAITGAGIMAAAAIPVLLKLRDRRSKKAHDADCDKKHAQVKAECKPKHDEVKKEVESEVKVKLDGLHDLVGAMINCMCGSDAQFRENWRKWFAPKYGFGEEARKDR